MKNFVVLLCIPPATIDHWVASVDEATRDKLTQEMMQDWQAWMAAHKASILEQGFPVGKTKRVTADGAADTRNDITYQMIVQAESHDAAAAMFKDHPHLRIPAAYVDISDASHRGMDA